MSLINLIQTIRTELRGNAYKVVEYNILTLLVGELETVSKREGSPVTDDKVIAMARKLIKSNTETLKLVANPKLEKENVYLEQFLPQQMSEEQIRSELQFYHATEPFKDIGDVMKYMNKMYAGKFDKGITSKIAKELF